MDPTDPDLDPDLFSRIRIWFCQPEFLWVSGATIQPSDSTISNTDEQMWLLRQMISQTMDLKWLGWEFYYLSSCEWLAIWLDCSSGYHRFPETLYISAICLAHTTEFARSIFGRGNSSIISFLTLRFCLTVFLLPHFV